MMRLACGVALWGAVAVSLGQGIQWRTDPQQAIQEAKKTERPLIVYVLGSSKDRDDTLERVHRQSLADPRVMELAQSFVPLRLSRSQHRDVLREFHQPESANMQMTFVAPDGALLGEISSGGIGQVDSLLQKLSGALDAYARRIYENDVKPKLAADANAADVRTALNRVAELRMAAAEQDVLQLLDRNPDAQTKAAALKALGVLSTKAAVDKLIALYTAGDDAALKALEAGTPVAAEILLQQLQASETFDYNVYKTITQIVRIRNVKPAKFFENAKPQLRDEELERIGKLVQDAARKWKETNRAG